MGLLDPLEALLVGARVALAHRYNVVDNGAFTYFGQLELEGEVVGIVWVRTRCLGQLDEAFVAFGKNLCQAKYVVVNHCVGDHR